MDKKVVEKVLFIRRFEEKIIEIYHTDVIKSPVHLSIGQELFSVLLAENTKKGDKIVTSGGITGTISRVIDNDKIEVEIADNVTVEVVRGTGVQS